MPCRAAAQGPCDGRPISSLRVRTQTLFVTDDSPIPGFVQNWGNALHWKTREETVRRELLFAPGEPCDQRRLDETERLLRAQPYLRSAVISTQLAADGGADVTVVTRDDWSIRGSARFEGGGGNPVRRFRIAEENLWGRGLRAQIRFNNEGRRPGFDTEVSTHQLFGRYDGNVIAGNSSVGLVAEQSVLRPFESEFDRMAWREATRYRKEPFLFASRDMGGVIQPTVVTGADIGTAARFGRPGRLLVTGAMLSYERVFVEGAPLAREPAGDSAAAAGLAGLFRERRRVRAHVLVGARSLRFTRQRGVDAVNAEEDLRLGFEGGIVAGRTLFGGGGLQHDWFGAVEAYSGINAGRHLLFVRAKWEGRWLYAERVWDGVIGSADVTLYRASQRSTLVFGLSGAGGWRTTTPFQLNLAGPLGVRGYGGMPMPVARRLVLHGEQRRFLGTMLGAVDIGTALFMDLGQGWKGRVPFGENTGLVGAVGGGLRVAFPSGSRLTYRLDIAFPVSGGSGFEVRTGFRQQFGIFRGEAEDVIRSREQVSSVTVFNFPRF